MKRTTTILLVIGLSLSLASTHEAAAGWFGKDKNKKLSGKRTEKPEEMKKAHRYETMPRASFHVGALSRDRTTGWQVGEMRLQLAKNCVVESEGAEKAVLMEGKEAVVMGPRVGNTIVAWRVRVLDPDFGLREPKPNMELEPSAANPDVGVIVSAPH